MFPDIDRPHRMDWRRETGKAHTVSFRIAVYIDQSNSLPPFTYIYNREPRLVHYLTEKSQKFFNLRFVLYHTMAPAILHKLYFIQPFNPSPPLN